MLKCSSSKRAYLTAELAEDALIEAHIQFDYRSGQGPVGVYQCETCGQFHLTSKGLLNEKLADYQRNGKIKNQQQANQWLAKLKKR